MISIIICCRTQIISNDLSDNIKKTVGCEYELIVIDNSENTYSIFEAYNLGIDKSTGDYLCFIHDDILIHTIGWGNTIEGVFKNDNQVGLIGVAGAKLKTKMPSPWWNCPEDQKVICIIQHHADKKEEKMISGFDNDALVEVVVIDGIFMAMRKDEHVLFDTTLKGFHNYDLNISFEYKKRGYKVVVTNQVIIEHYSTGNINAQWVKSTYKIHKKYKNSLPLKNESSTIKKGTEIANAINFIEESVKFKKFNIAYLIWWKLFCLYPNIKYHIKFWRNVLNRKRC
ncbi:hypothetical protein EKL99_06795 [Flavobacterium sp. ZB4P23]|uniref:glycosyltransferase n=1 Tax=Flavobacterium sp. ZB4P23 TaxID=2497484 RepID=UPI000F82AABA|nr:glycosyltransferase [Flavobacterium sp. ZB4P23]RTY83273.1 hypothetical protein EKL99_06795 [Flavobacterium sp. ZB4P23]